MRILRLVLLSAAAIAATVLVQAQQAPGGPPAVGFVALQGASAAAYGLQPDQRLVGSGPAGAGGALTVERYRQYVGDAEVLGGQVTIYRDATGARSAVIGAHYPDLTPSNSVVLTPGAAQAVVAARQNGIQGSAQSTLMLHPATARYFYRVDLRGTGARWFAWIDAETGDVINEYDGLTTGSGIGVNGDTKDLTGLTTRSGGSYQMSTARLRTYDAGNRGKLPGSLATDDDDTWDTAGRASPGQAALVDAHFYANVSDQFYTALGFNWLTYYTRIQATAHYSRNYNNAFWDGTQLVFGDGDGKTFVELSGDLDVVAHEMGHGVTEATSNLIYQGESGALNEAFSDIMGTAAEFFHGTGNWTIGEDITPGANGIRNMANPGEDGDPSHYDDRYTGTGDNGGVHINSGIPNHWFYLLVNGGQNAKASRASGTNVQGIGLANAKIVAYSGFTALTATANFCQARASTIGVAGSHSANVADAWDEVGVTDALCSGAGSGSGSSGATTGGGDTTAPAISNVDSSPTGGTNFVISWTTDEPSTSVVTFAGYGSYSNTELVTSHQMSFRGSKRVLYEYYVASTDGSGNTTTAGPFYHQN